MTRHNFVDVWIMTGWDPRGEAGTNGDVYFRAKGTLGWTSEVELDTPNYDNFRQNKEDHFDIRPEFVGPIEFIEIRHEGGTGWLLKWVKVAYYPHPDQANFERANPQFTFNAWLDDETIRLYPDTGKLENREYIIATYTGDVTNAGTSGDIQIRLFGPKGRGFSNFAHLSFGVIERNQTNQYQVTIDYVGEPLSIEKIEVRHNGIEGWYLDKVHINSETPGVEGPTFYFNRWIHNKTFSSYSNRLIDHSNPLNIGPWVKVEKQTHAEQPKQVIQYRHLDNRRLDHSPMPYPYFEFSTTLDRAIQFQNHKRTVATDQGQENPAALLRQIYQYSEKVAGQFSAAVADNFGRIDTSAVTRTHRQPAIARPYTLFIAKWAPYIKVLNGEVALVDVHGHPMSPDMVLRVFYLPGEYGRPDLIHGVDFLSVYEVRPGKGLDLPADIRDYINAAEIPLLEPGVTARVLPDKGLNLRVAPGLNQDVKFLVGKDQKVKLIDEPAKTVEKVKKQDEDYLWWPVEWRSRRGRVRGWLAENDLDPNGVQSWQLLPDNLLNPPSG